MTDPIITQVQDVANRIAAQIDHFRAAATAETKSAMTFATARTTNELVA